MRTYGRHVSRLMVPVFELQKMRENVYQGCAGFFRKVKITSVFLCVLIVVSGNPSNLGLLRKEHLIQGTLQTVEIEFSCILFHL